MLSERYLFSDPGEEISFAIPARNVGLVVKSHGSNVYGRILLPAAQSRDERTPLVLLLHGYPGLEQNMDVPPALRRVGIATAYFSYRGVWGGHGDYCFSHVIEDVASVLEHLRLHADKYMIDPEKVFLVGHSMGGFATLNAIACGAAVKGAVLIAPGDIGYIYEEKRKLFDQLMLSQKYGYFRTPYDSFLEEDVAAHAKEWRFDALAEKIPQTMPLHFIGAAEDVVVPPEQHIKPIFRLLKERGLDVTYQELQDGHTIPSCRIALIKMIYQKIAQMAEGCCG